MWLHVGSDDERTWAMEQIAAAGWRVLAADLPRFFVVGVRPDLSGQERRRLVQLIAPKQEPADVRFLGALFGYPAADIDWYLSETAAHVVVVT